MNADAAIVVTLTNAHDILQSFVRYHLAIGFKKLYLFFDNPHDPAISLVRGFPEVVAFLNDADLHDQWKSLRTYANHSRFITKEVMSRQVLNAELAARLAFREGIAWLLHIDIDELFYIEGETVNDHFSSLDRQGYTHATYLNYEAVPISLDTRDFFREIKVFRKHKALLSDEQLEYCSRQEVFNYGKDYFWYYENGKSAVKLSDETFPDSVHSFSPRENFVVCEEPVVLHYPICGFTHFWLKYSTLGRFADMWFDNLPITSSMHLKGRDLVAAGSREQAEEFYGNLVSRLAEATPRLLAQEILCRIDGPSRVITNSLTK